MKVKSSYQHSALSRQCGEAVRIREIDPKRRINNKQEYHQPGDVEISYKKNEKEFLIINDKKDNKDEESINNKDYTEVVIECENEEYINQRRIPEYFVQKIRKESEQTKESTDIEDTGDKVNEVDSISTPQWIHEARERREHQLEEKGDVKEMRNRITCEECSFKTTSSTNLKLHQNSNHKKKEQKIKASSRIKCNICDKKFNKKSTFEIHMQTYHENAKNVTNVINETQTGSLGTHTKRIQEVQNM